MSKACDQRSRYVPRMVIAGIASASILVCPITQTAHATIQEESCIYPDVEYPMPCDDED